MGCLAEKWLLYRNLALVLLKLVSHFRNADEKAKFALAHVLDKSFLLVLVALNSLFVYWPSISGPSGPESKGRPLRFLVPL